MFFDGYERSEVLFRPLPDHAEFEDAFLVYGRILKKRGGPGEDAMRKVTQVWGNNKERTIRFNIAKLTVNSRRVIVDDENLRVHRAFIQGYSQHMEIARVMYRGGESYNLEVTESFGHLVEQSQEMLLSDPITSKHIAPIDSVGHYHFALSHLERYGMETLGQGAHAQVTLLSETIHPLNERYRKAYVVGHGALAITAFLRQHEVNSLLSNMVIDTRFGAPSDPSTEE